MSVFCRFCQPQCFYYSWLNELWLPLCLQQVHKLVLLAASPYLQSTFRHANPTSHLEVNLPRDTGVGAARDFLKYIYQGVLHVAPDTVNALRRIAAMLQIDQLLTYCDDYINCLTGTSTASLSHHSTLPHNSPQVCGHIFTFCKHSTICIPATMIGVGNGFGTR